MNTADRYWWIMGTEGDGNPHSFMGRYPGDGFVDIFGYDDYKIGTGTNEQTVVKLQESAVAKMRPQYVVTGSPGFQGRR